MMDRFAEDTATPMRFEAGSTSYDVFMSFIKAGSLSDELDVSGIFSVNCFQTWVRTRKNPVVHPEQAFHRTVMTHLRGSDTRKPFPPQIEAEMLRLLRDKDANIWDRCFPNGNELNIGKFGCRHKGYHEKKGDQGSSNVHSEKCKKEVDLNDDNIKASKIVKKRKLSQKDSLPTLDAEEMNSDGSPCDTIIPRSSTPASSSSLSEGVNHISRATIQHYRKGLGQYMVQNNFFNTASMKNFAQSKLSQKDSLPALDAEEMKSDGAPCDMVISGSGTAATSSNLSQGDSHISKDVIEHYRKGLAQYMVQNNFLSSAFMKNFAQSSLIQPGSGGSTVDAKAIISTANLNGNINPWQCLLEVSAREHGANYLSGLSSQAAGYGVDMFPPALQFMMSLPPTDYRLNWSFICPPANECHFNHARSIYSYIIDGRSLLVLDSCPEIKEIFGPQFVGDFVYRYAGSLFHAVFSLIQFIPQFMNSGVAWQRSFSKKADGTNGLFLIRTSMRRAGLTALVEMQEITQDFPQDTRPFFI